MWWGCLFPFSGPNVIATVHDITPPEVRSTALAIQSFIESAGATLAPLLVGILAVQTSLTATIQAIYVATWLLCAGFLNLAIIAVPAISRSYETRCAGGPVSLSFVVCNLPGCLCCILLRKKASNFRIYQVAKPVQGTDRYSGLRLC